MHTRGIFLATLAVGLVFGVGLAESGPSDAARAGAAAVGAITVTGSGVVWAEPDQAVIEVGWSGVDAEVGTAVAAADDAIAAIRAAVEASGVDARDVRTIGFFVWREDRWDEGDAPRLVGYRVTHSLQVVVRDVDAVAALITAATDAGANQIGGISFTVADRQTLEGEARAAAFASARRRALELADLAGLRLGAVAEVEELSRGVPAAMEAMLDTGGLGGAPAAGRHAVEVLVRVTFAAGE